MAASATALADEAYIREQLEFQAVNALLSWTAIFVLARSLMRGSRKAGVAASASTTTSNHDAFVGMGEVVNFLSSIIVIHNCSDWNFKDDILALAAGLVRAFAVTSALRFVFGIEAEVHQRVVPLTGFHVDVTALTPVAA